MINQVPIKIMEASRTVTLKHPNSMDCVIYRKVVNRTNQAGEAMGGAPTLGGLGMLSSEDEDDFEYQALGAGKILVTARFDGPLDLVDLGNTLAPEVAHQEAMIEAVDALAFTPKKNDLVAVMPGGGVLIGFEIVGVNSNVNIYPHTTKYVIAPRDELHDLAPWTP